MKLKAYNKKVIKFVWKNRMTSYFVTDGPCKFGPSTRQKNSVIIFSHTKYITYKYVSWFIFALYFMTLEYFVTFEHTCHRGFFFGWHKISLNFQLIEKRVTKKIKWFIFHNIYSFCFLAIQQLIVRFISYIKPFKMHFSIFCLPLCSSFWDTIRFCFKFWRDQDHCLIYSQPARVWDVLKNWRWRHQHKPSFATLFHVQWNL
jgi:hypothetical protein